MGSDGWCFHDEFHPENMKNMFTKRNDNSPELIREIFIEGYDYRRLLREYDGANYYHVFIILLVRRK